MANGSSHEGPARADRVREENRRHERFIQKQFDGLPARDLPVYREKQDSEITFNTRLGDLRAKGVPPWALGGALLLLAAAAVVVVVMKAFGKL